MIKLVDLNMVQLWKITDSNVQLNKVLKSLWNTVNFNKLLPPCFMVVKAQLLKLIPWIKNTNPFMGKHTFSDLMDWHDWRRIILTMLLNVVKLNVIFVVFTVGYKGKFKSLIRLNVSLHQFKYKTW